MEQGSGQHDQKHGGMGVGGQGSPSSPGSWFHDHFVVHGVRLCLGITSLSPSVSSGRSTLSRCCNAPSYLFTTQKNTPLGTKLKYEVDTSGIFHINQEIFRMFPKVRLRQTAGGGTD